MRTRGRRLMVLLGVLAITTAACGGSAGTRQSKPSVKTSSVAVSGDALEAYPGNDAEDPEVDGGFAPVLKGKDFAGRAVRIGFEMGVNGKKKAVLFVAHWCRDCSSQVRSLADWLEAPSLPANAALYIVATGNDPNKVNYPASAWLSGARMGHVPTLVDSARRDAARAFGYTKSPSSPYWVFLDEASDVMGRHEGLLSEEAFDTAIAALARGDKVTIGGGANHGGTTTTITTTTAPRKTTTTVPPTAPPPTEPGGSTEFTAATLLSMVGRPVTNGEWNALADVCHGDIEGQYVHCEDTRGFVLSVVNGSVREVTLYGSSPEWKDWAVFAGRLPGGVSWGDDLSDVEGAIGQPACVETDMGYAAHYTSQSGALDLAYGFESYGGDWEGNGAGTARDLHSITVHPVKYRPATCM